MTALTTILSMSVMVFSQDAGNAMQKGMAVVVAFGLLYATLMTLFIVPVMYDILYRKQPKVIDVEDSDLWVKGTPMYKSLCPDRLKNYWEEPLKKYPILFRCAKRYILLNKIETSEKAVRSFYGQNSTISENQSLEKLIIQSKEEDKQYD